MAALIPDIKTFSRINKDFRKVLFTSPYHVQLTIMNLLPQEEIGEEVHDSDQIIRVEEGEGVAIFDNDRVPLYDNSIIIITKGTNHNIINTSKTKNLKLTSIYSPPVHETQ